MKIVLNREEIKSLRKLANTINDINGIPVDRAKELVDQTVTTKAYILSMLTGQMTIELNEEMVLEFLAITNALMADSAPILKDVHSLGQALAPTFDKYGERYAEFINRYQTPSFSPNWEIKSITSEQVEEREVC